MNGTKWAAAPIIIVTVLLVAAAGVLAAGAGRTGARQATASSTSRGSAVARDAASAPRPGAAVGAPAEGREAKASTARQAKAPARVQANAAAKRTEKAPAAPKRTAQKRVALQNGANDLGWRLGTEWTVRVEEKAAAYLALSQDVRSEYRFEVVAADDAEGAYEVAMRFADPSIQPESARGELLRAGYSVVDGDLKLAWLQPGGEGRKLQPSEAERLLGTNTLSMDVSASGSAAGAKTTARVPGLGVTAATKVRLGRGESVTYAKGAPWWVSYEKGSSLKARLLSFER